MKTTIQRTTQQKLDLFARFFTGRREVYGTYDPATGQVRQVKAPVTRQVFYDHLVGRQPYGLYLLEGDKTRAVVADFDDEDLNPPLAFFQAALRYQIPVVLERSKSKGYHAWIFFDRPVPAQKARQVVRHILEEIEQPSVEVFPKQDALDARTPYGNFINAPLFGRLVPQGRSVFVDPNDPTKPVADPWSVLEKIHFATEKVLNEVIEMNQLEVQVDPETPSTPADPREPWVRYGLPPCTRRILREGVRDFQRVTCFRLAVHLDRLGLPQDLTAAALKHWALKNRPTPPKRIISSDEIDHQVRDAYEKGYRGLGCEDPAIEAFCDPACPLYSKTDFSWPEKGVSHVPQ
jgi:hypothetical protein